MSAEKAVFYKLSKSVKFSDTIPDRRLGYSQIGLLAIILTCVAPDKRFRAENFGKYTYEDVSITADNLSVLEKCGYVRRAS